MAEIKYVDGGKFKIDKLTAKNLINKIDVFRRETKTKKQIFLSLITTEGLQHNLYTDDLSCTEVTLDHLFADV